tara:strand:+ start:115 stop:489 length:375 start_codon:yes stop_codon:yes gene_type:complete
MLNKTKDNFLSKASVENVQKKKIEHKLIASFMRSKGLKLLSYSILLNEVVEVVIRYSNEAHVFYNGTRLDWYDPETSRSNIDSSNIHFEALNMGSAKVRVSKFKKGSLKELHNLKPVANKSIIF